MAHTAERIHIGVKACKEVRVLLGWRWEKTRHLMLKEVPLERALQAGMGLTF